MAEVLPVAASPFAPSFGAPPMLEAPEFSSVVASAVTVALVSPLAGTFEPQLARAAMELQASSETTMMPVNFMMRTPVLKRAQQYDDSVLVSAAEPNATRVSHNSELDTRLVSSALTRVTHYMPLEDCVYSEAWARVG